MERYEHYVDGFANKDKLYRDLIDSRLEILDRAACGVVVEGYDKNWLDLRKSSQAALLVIKGYMKYLSLKDEREKTDCFSHSSRKNNVLLKWVEELELILGTFVDDLEKDIPKKIAIDIKESQMILSGVCRKYAENGYDNLLKELARFRVSLNSGFPIRLGADNDS